MNPQIVITPVKLAVHRMGDNPVFAESVISVSIDDEAAGPFIVLEGNDAQEEHLRVDMEELEAVLVAARQLIAGLPKEGGE